MLNKINAFLLALVLVQAVVIATLTLAPPSPQAQEQSATQQQSETKAKDDSPLSRFWHWTSHDPVAFYTGVLAVFTGLLVAVSTAQGWFLLRADKTARIAANAADLSARAAVGQKLPIIRCKTPHMWPAKDQFHAGSFAGTGDPTSDDFIKVIRLELINHGETLAHPQEYGLGWMLTEKEPTERDIDSLPPEPVYTDIYSLSHELVIKDTFDTPTIYTFCLILDDSLKSKIKGAAVILRLCAYVKYRDFLDNPHEARFCWRWGQGSRDGRYHAGLSRDGGAPESYTRKT